MITKMTPSELKHQVSGTGSPFFHRNTLRFFGDTMKNYGVRSKPVEITTNYNAEGEYVGEGGGIVVLCWELYRKHPVKHGLSKSAFFDVVTFQCIKN